MTNIYVVKQKTIFYVHSKGNKYNNILRIIILRWKPRVNKRINNNARLFNVRTQYLLIHFNVKTRENIFKLTQQYTTFSEYFQVQSNYAYVFRPWAAATCSRSSNFRSILVCLLPLLFCFFNLLKPREKVFPAFHRWSPVQSIFLCSLLYLPKNAV